jgi:DtxR family Mn-dependent transcriptional regulator
VAGALAVPLEESVDLLSRLESARLVERHEGSARLTGEGRKYARHVLRAHRLFETYLAHETGFREDQWHRKAEKKEHTISESDLEEMARGLGDPRFDPHGDPIPTVQGEIPPHQGRSLLDYPPGWEGRIVHVEDEPPHVYAELVAQGVAVGLRIRIVDVDPGGVRVNAEGRTLALTRTMAVNVVAAPLDPEERFDEDVDRLSSLRAGEKAVVVSLSPACRGTERSRLLDLGLVPGTEVELNLVSPSGNPVAYRIRGASIALRTEQADRILIKKD